MNDNTIVKPINMAADECAFAVCARYGAACVRNLIGGGHNYPMTGVIELTQTNKNEPETPKNDV